MHILAVSAFLYVLAVLFAVFEIEAEGRYGWGEKFPTWYRTSGWAKIYTSFTNKPLTGYHAALFFVPVLVFLWPMVATSTLTLQGAFAALAAYFAWVAVWDFAWFVLNPFYGVRNFRRTNVWWFASEPWIGRVPMSYISAWCTSLALATVGGGISGGALNAFGNQIQQLGWYLLATLLLALFGAPLFARYYEAMRRTDERQDAGIFHDR